MPSRYWYYFSGIVPVAMQDIPFPPVLVVLLFLPQQTVACSSMSFLFPSLR